MAARVMRARLSAGALVSVALLAACDGSKTSSPPSPAFTCIGLPDGSWEAGGVCDGSCTAQPVDAGGCVGIPGLFGHDPEQLDASWAIGCYLVLPYENPHYQGLGGQPCNCDPTFAQTDGGLLQTGGQWTCPL